MITIDFLKKNVTMIHYFGLGFVQVKVGESDRFHFYHKDVPAFVDEPHDHRYNFTSNIHRGELRNTIWVPDPEGHIIGVLEEESCREGVSPPGGSVPVKLRSSVSFVTLAGSSYMMHCDTLHTVEPLLDRGPVVTHVHRWPVVKEYARVFRKDGAEKVCPFSVKMSDDDLWAIVADCLGE